MEVNKFAPQKVFGGPKYFHKSYVLDVRCEYFWIILDKRSTLWSEFKFFEINI